ncbi:hypothetical protein KC342_g16161 [Hortaea werneckii]|nr:hypothetical protein KC342_g16161 [Hortaea werneckii]KAI7378268.1 hypothetical protein KC328_g13973 [Hortaea werneckii]
MEARPAKLKDPSPRDEALTSGAAPANTSMQTAIVQRRDHSVEGCEEQATGCEEGSPTQRRDPRISTVMAESNSEGIGHVSLWSKERYLVDYEACCENLWDTRLLGSDVLYSMALMVIGAGLIRRQEQAAEYAKVIEKPENTVARRDPATHQMLRL